MTERRVSPMEQRANELARRVWALVSRVGVRVWQDDRLFLAVLAVTQIYFARGTFGAGIWADNDSVCHYAYAKHLVEEFYPATGTIIGYSPRFNLGVPFLVYNTPPGIYVITWATAGALHISTLAALKAWTLIAYLAVPLSSYWLGRTFEEEQRTDLPKYMALATSLFSSELFGLEFYFKNGMLNPAFAVPMMIAALAAFRGAMIRERFAGLAHLALGAVFVSLTICTHLLTTYMLGISLLMFTVAPGVKKLGANAFRLGIVLGVGILLSAWWLYPSMKFAATEDAAYTWLRRPSDTISAFFDGSLLSSYFAGFFPTFIAVSNVGFVAVACGGVGVVEVVRKKSVGARSLLLVAVLAFWIGCGPWASWGVRFLPAYDRLLWYRFVTLAAAAWFLLAGYGAYRLSSREFRFYPLNIIFLAVGGLLSLVVLSGRSAKIYTASDFPQFLRSVDQIAGWLRDHGDRRGRLYSEFLGQAVVQPPSVNYTRHMLPVMTGFDEVSGWIYENNVASQVLQRRGPFWYDPFPIIESAPLYNTKYVVAGSPQFIRALSLDPRWEPVLQTPDLVLFENRSFEPRLAEAEARDVSLTRAEMTRGGGYAWSFDVRPGTARPSAPVPAGKVLVKVGYLPGFHADLDGKPVAVAPTEDGLVALDVPEGSGKLSLTWDITALRRTGNRFSLAGLAVLLLLFAASRTKREAPKWAPRALQLVGSAGFALVVVGVVARSKGGRLEDVGFGVRGGLLPSSDPNRLEVGAYYDDARPYPQHLLASAWGPRHLTPAGETARALTADGAWAAELALRPQGTNRVRVVTSGEPRAFAIALGPPAAGAKPSCEVTGRTGEWLTLPPACLEGGERGESPGRSRYASFTGLTGAEITALEVDAGVRYVEAESLVNVYDDGGSEAFYAITAIEHVAMNGIVMYANAEKDKPVALRNRFDFAPGRYTVWLLTRTLHPRFKSTRAEVSIEVDGVLVGSVDGAARKPRDFWERDVIFEWIEVGVAEVKARSLVELTLKKRSGAVAGLADLDALAFVPSP